MAISLLMVVVGGCMRASLATDTGLSTEGQWSVAPQQSAHVGEKVDFSVVLMDMFQRPRDALGLADYTTLTVGNDRMDGDLEPDGRFHFAYTFSLARPGDRIRVTTAVTKQKGLRDFMKVGQEWMQCDSPYDERDIIVARAHVELECYQVRVEIKLELPEGDYDWASARLVLLKHGDSKHVVYEQQGVRCGFTVQPFGTGGGCRVIYEPLATEINKTGHTAAEFSVQDLAGKLHQHRVNFPTP